MTQVLMLFQIYISTRSVSDFGSQSFFTCLVNWMDGPGQVESKEGGGGGDEDGGQVELLLPHLQVSMVMAGKV